MSINFFVVDKSFFVLGAEHCRLSLILFCVSMLNVSFEQTTDFLLQPIHVNDPSKNTSTGPIFDLTCECLNFVSPYLLSPKLGSTLWAHMMVIRIIYLDFHLRSLLHRSVYHYIKIIILIK